MRKLDYFKRFTYIPNEVYEHLKALEDAAGGDIDLVILPAMSGEGADGPALQPTVSEANDTDDPYVVTVTVKLMDKAKTNVMEWFCGKRKVTVDISTSGGKISINGGDFGSVGADVTFDLEFENGVGTFTVKLGGTWAENDTVKVNADNDASNQSVGIMGYTVKKENHYLIKVAADPGDE